MHVNTPLTRAIGVLILIVAIPSIYSAQMRPRQAQAQATPPTPVFSDIRHFAEIPQAELPADFAVAGYAYKSLPDSSITSSKPGTPQRTYRLRLPADAAASPLYYQEYEGDALVLCLVEYDDGDGVGGWLVRLDPRMGRIVWECAVPVLHIGQPLVEDGYVYVTGRRFIGKVNLATGVYVWKYEPLRWDDARDGFEFIAIMEIKGDIVRFQERDFYKHPGKQSVALDKRNGKPIREGAGRGRR